MQSSSRVHRLARPEDLAEIVAIYNSTVLSRLVTADLEPVSIESRRAWFDSHSAESRPIWVVEGERGVAAWLSFSSFYGRPAYRRTAELAVYVHEQQRRRGIARYLLLQALAAAPDLGLDTLLGFIFGHNQPSLVLFEQFGFGRWGTLPRVAVLDGIERDLIILGLRVSPDR